MILLDYPPATSVLCAALSRRLPGVPVRWTVPNPRPLRFVAVYRTGNTAGPRWTDPAAFDLHCWDETPKAAEQLANQVKTALDQVSGPDTRIAQTTVTGQSFMPDPTTGIPRMIIGVNVLLRPDTATP